MLSQARYTSPLRHVRTDERRACESRSPLCTRWRRRATGSRSSRATTRASRRVLDAAGVETLLIGDSLGNVLQGHESTLPVTLRDIVYHTQCVARGAKRAFIIGDMPFGTFQISPQETFRNAARDHGGGRADGEARRRRPMLRHRALPDRARHSGVRPSRTSRRSRCISSAATRSRARQKDDAPAPARGCEDARGGGRGHDRARSDSGGAREATSRGRCAARPSASAPASTVTGRCWCFYDMLDIFPGKKAKFVKNYMRARRHGPGRGRALREGSEGGDVPGPEHSLLTKDGHHPFRRRSARTPAARARTTSSCRRWAICTKATSS